MFVCTYARDDGPHFDVADTAPTVMANVLHAVGRIVIKMRPCETRCARGSLLSFPAATVIKHILLICCRSEREPIRTVDSVVRTARGPKTGRRKKRKVTAPFRTCERAGGRAAIEALPKIWACIRETKTHLCGEERKEKQVPATTKYYTQEWWAFR